MNDTSYIYVKDDLRNTIKLNDIIKNHEIDTVIHLACISNDPTFELKSDISKNKKFWILRHQNQTRYLNCNNEFKKLQYT